MGEEGPAALGARVVKSGNRSVSSKSGSADLLESLGLPIALDPDRAFEQFERTGFAFLFAPAYHPAVAHVQPVRAELKLPTIFNVLGPLLSPAAYLMKSPPEQRPDDIGRLKLEAYIRGEEER